VASATPIPLQAQHSSPANYGFSHANNGNRLLPDSSFFAAPQHISMSQGSRLEQEFVEMALAETTLVRESSNVFANIGNAILRTMTAIAEADGRVRRVQQLQAMSDAELAKRGLKRDEIVHHVFRSTYYM
jgi:uncharacterized protein YjiS (DUF1127 family)